MFRAHSAALLSALPVALVTAHSAACITNPFVPASAGDDASVGFGDGGPIVVVSNDDGSDGARDVASCSDQARPADSGCVLEDGSGVFVAPTASGGSDSDGNGTRGRPYATIGFALTHLGGTSRVYACDGDYTESLTMVAPGASLYGGLACPGSDAGAWTYEENGHARVTAPGGSYALHAVDLPDPIEIQDVAFVAPDAKGTDAAGNGASSIAVFLEGVSATLTRVTIVAGAGRNGSDGAGGTTTDPNWGSAVAGSGAPGTVPADAGTDASSSAGSGAGGTATCLLYGSSLGGSGGAAGTSTVPGGDGGAGSLMLWPDASSPYSPPPGTLPQGLGGGSSQYACTAGLSGADGIPGAGGVSASSFGTLTAGGWTPASGGSGQAGGPGQGGGGGGGRGYPLFSGGDGGGAGGCGGAGGGGGHGGGSSIALAAFASTVTLRSCALTTANGGNGGNGGAGQAGQAGAVSRDLDGGACTGGMGGNGAGGSGGAGGAEGMSVDVVLDKASSRLTSDMSTTFTQGAAGQPGDGGNGGAHGGGSSSSGQNGTPGARGYNDVLGVGSSLHL